MDTKLPPAHRGRPRAFIKYRWSEALNCIIPEATHSAPPLAVYSGVHKKNARSPLLVAVVYSQIYVICNNAAGPDGS